jgi:hypothetical protein
MTKLIKEGFTIQDGVDNDDSLFEIDNYKLGWEYDGKAFEIKNELKTTQQNNLGTYVTTTTILGEVNDSVNVNILPFNAIPFWLMLGKVTNTTANTKHTIEPITNTEIYCPRIKVYQQLDDDTSQLVHGVVATTLEASISNGTKPLTLTLKGKGMKIETVDYVITDPEIPSDEGQIYTTIQSCSWNGNSILNDLSDINLSISRSIKAFENLAGEVYDIVEGNDFSIGFSITCNHKVAALHTDFKNRTLRRLKYKMIKRIAENYIEVDTLTDCCKIVSITENIEQDRLITYTYYFIAENINVIGNDLVNDSFYTRP